MLFSAYDTPTIFSTETGLRACVAGSWREDVQKQSHYILVYKGEKRVAIRNNLLVTPKVKKAECLSDPSLVFWCGVMVICARLYADRCSEQTFVGTIKKMIRLPKTKHHRSSCNRTPPMEMEASAAAKIDLNFPICISSDDEEEDGPIYISSDDEEVIEIQAPIPLSSRAPITTNSALASGSSSFPATADRKGKRKLSSQGCDLQFFVVLDFVFRFSPGCFT